MNDVLLPALTLLAGLILGALVTLAVTRRAGGGRSAGDLRRELDQYRDDVANHYADTARKIDTLTRAYKDVYDHLEDGAHRLVGEEPLRARLQDAAPTTVTLEGIGARRLDATTSATSHGAGTGPVEGTATDDAERGPHAPSAEDAESLPDWEASDVEAANVPDAWTTPAEDPQDATDPVTPEPSAAPDDDATRQPAMPSSADTPVEPAAAPAPSGEEAGEEDVREENASDQDRMDPSEMDQDVSSEDAPEGESGEDETPRTTS